MRRFALVLTACAWVTGAHAQSQLDDRRTTAIQHACLLGLMSDFACRGQTSLDDRAAFEVGEPFVDDHGRPFAKPGRAFSDPRGRYRLTTPGRWEAKLQGDTLGLTLNHAWMEVVATSAATPQAAAMSVGATFNPAFKQLQLVKQSATRFGNHEGFGIMANGVTAAKGEAMSVLVLAISAGGGHDIVIVSATPSAQSQLLNTDVLSMANSIRFQGE